MKIGKKGRACVLLTVLLVCSIVSSEGQVKDAVQSVSKHRFAISFSEQKSREPLDGRMLLLISADNSKEPRFQINEDPNTQQVFGVDVDSLKAGETSLIDASVLGYPRRSLSDEPPDEYCVHALLHRYETFKRADGHTVKLPMDRGEGQQWSRAPGNLYSTPKRMRIDGNT